MSENVEVPQGDNAGDTATLLLAAAQELDLDPSVVTVTSSGSEGLSYSAPPEVVDKAGLGDKPEKKTAAKKTTAKK